jgi:hypothetical protein
MHRPDSPAYNRADALCCGRLALTFYEKEGLSLHRELRAVWTVTVAISPTCGRNQQRFRIRGANEYVT